MKYKINNCRFRIWECIIYPYNKRFILEPDRFKYNAYYNPFDICDLFKYDIPPHIISNDYNVTWFSI